MPPLLNGNPFTLDSLPEEQVPSDTTAAAPQFLLIETNDTLDRDQKQRLESLGVLLQRYIGDNIFLCKSQQESPSVLVRENFIKSARSIPPDLKIQPSLKTDNNAAEEIPRTVDIVLHQRADQTIEELSQDIQSLAAIKPEDISFRRDDTIIRATIDQVKLLPIAALSNVGSIEEVQDLALHNNIAREVMHADKFHNSTLYRGKNQVITVADTGFDTGDKANPHPAFTGRVKELIAVGRATSTDDRHGHGTHVCGSVLGNGNSATMGGQIQGTAPEALLVMQALQADDGSLFGKKDSKTTLLDLFKQAYVSFGSRIHTNSWGPIWSKSKGQLPYNNASEDIDRFIWDHKDLLVCFSAGNNGEMPTALGHIGGQAAAKNCITVGSCDNRRKSPNNKIEVFSEAGPVEGNPDNISTFSSQGPTLEHRVKPDVVAPGGIVLSTASRAAKASAVYGPSKDPAWKFSSGTSMSTPLVAGCLAVMRQALVETAGIAHPSASLLKAMLINGAVNGGKSQAQQGFGRVDLSNSIIIKGETNSRDFYEGVIYDQKDKDIVMVHFNIKDYAKKDAKTMPLKVTMVYMDQPDAVLQNNINLKARVTDGVGFDQVCYGNMAEKQGADAHDDINNVEQVTFTNVPIGCAVALTVSLRGVLLCPSLPFSLVWSVD